MLHQQRAGEQLRPAAQHLIVVPALRAGGVHAHDEAVVVAHHRVGGHIDGEDRGELADACFHPGAAVLEAAACVRIMPAQEGAAHAAVDDVVLTCPVSPRH